MRYLDKYPNCVGCPVKKWCGTMISCIRLCNSYQDNKEEMKMNYEQKYKEALERAKEKRDEYKRLDGEESFVPSDIEYIFPELRESEDERIRKELLEHCINRRDGKQVCVDASDYRRWAAWLEKQGEQKPVEWSEEDDRILYNVIAYIGFAAGQRGVRDDAFKEANHWLKSLKDRVQLQTKQKCDEEDEKKIMWLVRLISTAGFRELDNDKMPCSRSELLDWLKSLKDRVQPQLTQEWNEEDEEMYKEVLTDIIYAKNDLKTKGCLELSNRAMKAFNWFSKRHKSLRPQSKWKPSEEQMEALKNRTHGLHTSSETRKILESLINDLEKL